MNTSRFIKPILTIVVILLAAGLTGATSLTGATDLATTLASRLYLPLVVHSGTATSQAIIIDHTTADISKIPTTWVNQAKSNLRVSYGHTSHGSQLISGAQYWFTANPLYDYNTSGAVESGVLSIADYTPSGDLGNPDRTTWAALTRTYLNDAGQDRNIVMWSWCGEADTSDPADIDTYLNLMAQLEVDYPQVKFIYMTGHLVGSGPTGALYQRNNQIRAYARAHNKTLFDFADIESYDPAGNYYPNESDACAWCTSWCAAHPADCATLDTIDDCAHSHKLNCKVKGQAFWWLMARLAGWNGQ